jgi:hypothetical protein
MGWLEDKFQEFLAAVSRVKLGPGVLGTIVPIITVGLIAIAALVYALSSNPLYALIGLAIVIVFLVYATERAFRYAIKNPIPALLSGGEILQLIRDQTAARDKSIVVVEAKPEVGASVSAIEHRGDGNA